MRAFSYSFFSASMLASVAAFASATSSVNPTSSQHVIYGVANAKHFSGHANGQYYVQAATFKSAQGAQTYKRQLTRKFHQPVIVKTQGKYHVVLIGPFNSAAEVRALSRRSGLQAITVERTVVNNLPAYPVAIAINPAPNHFELIGALGVARLNTGNSNLGVTSSETDRLVQTNSNNWNTFAGQLGIGYVYYFANAQRYSDQLQWFPSVEPELNAYYLSKNSAVTGDVWRFGSPAFNQLTYKIPVRSSRLMLDAALTILSQQQFSLYAKGGIGNAWNRISYSDIDNEPNDPCPNQRLHLNSNTRSNFAWEAGGGVSYAFNDRVALSLEYLYADLGNTRGSAYGNTGTITVPVIVPPRFNLVAQTGLLGIHIAI